MVVLRANNSQSGPVIHLLLAITVLSLQIAPVKASLNPGSAVTQYIHKAWQGEAGLSESSVMSVAQTPDGYIWLGTENGLFRFDGVTFTAFDHLNTPAMGHNVVMALRVDRGGTLWIGTAGQGVVRMKDGLFQAPDPASDDKNDSVTSLFEDPGGRMWVGTDGNGLLRFEHGKSKRFTKESGLADNSVFAIAGDSEGTVWLATQTGLSRFENNQFNRIAQSVSLPTTDIRSLLCDRSGVLWIGSRRTGLYRLEAHESRRFGTENGLSSNVISSIYEDRAGTLWVGTLDNGINRFDDGRFTSLTTSNGFPSGGVWTIFEDKAGSVWLGGTESGLSCLRQGAITPIGRPEGLQPDTILGLYRDRHQGIWIGSDQGVSLRKQGRFRRYTAEQGLPDNLVFSITQDDKETIWAGTRHGLARLRGSRFEQFAGPGQPALLRPILCVYADHQGGIWAGGRGSLTYIKGKRVKTYTYEDGLPNKIVMSLFEDGAGTLWIGTDGGGLIRFRDGQFRAFTSHDGLSSDTICAIAGDPDGTLWLGTRGGGLMRFSKGKFVAFTRQSGLSDDDVFAVLDDTLGRLWFSSNKGIFSARKAELQAFADGVRSSISSTLYGTNDGMRSRECNGGFQSAGLRSPDGVLWFPTVKGVATLNPSRLLNPPPPSAVVLERILAGDKPVAPKHPIVIPARTKQLEFTFTSPYFTSPDALNYKYMLAGFDRHWASAEGRRVANYTNLPPGDYQFRVVACVNDICTKSATELDFKLLPAWYETRIFFLLAGLSLCGLGYGANKLHVKQLKLKEKRLQRLIAERTSELQESRDQLESRVEQRTSELSQANQQLGAEVTVRREAEQKAEAASQAKSQFLTNMSHELRTPMNGVIGMTNLAIQICENPQQREYLELLSQSADHLLSVLNDLLDFSKIESGKLLLEEAEFDLIELIERLGRTMSPAAEQKGLTLKTAIDPNLPRYVVTDPARLRQVLFNLVSNGIKFTAAGRIELLTTWKDGGVAQFTVIDTGIGIAPDQRASIFESFVQVDGGVARKFGGTGIGLAISDHLVRLMGGRIEVESEIGSGSAFSFSIPLTRRDTLQQDPVANPTATSEYGNNVRVETRKPELFHKLRVLVAEDNPVNQRLARALLQKAGHFVTLANDGLEAVAAVAQSEFDLVLMDVQMPGMDGLEATSAIRKAEKGRSRLPIIALTAHAMEGDRERCLNAGMDDYLTKPINVKRLMEQVAALAIAPRHLALEPAALAEQ